MAKEVDQLGNIHERILAEKVNDIQKWRLRQGTQVGEKAGIVTSTASWLKMAREKRHRGTMFFPDDLAGPDLIFILENGDGCNKIICSLQVCGNPYLACTLLRLNILTLPTKLKTGRLKTKRAVQSTGLLDVYVDHPNDGQGRATEARESFLAEVKAWKNTRVLRIVVAPSHPNPPKSTKILLPVFEQDVGMPVEYLLMIYKEHSENLFGDWFCKILDSIKSGGLQDPLAQPRGHEGRSSVWQTTRPVTPPNSRAAEIAIRLKPQEILYEEAKTREEMEDTNYRGI
jgi:hypothetical protein